MKRFQQTRAALLCGAAMALAVAATPAMAQSQVATINIQSQPMSGALKELARQSGVNLLFSQDTVKGLSAPTVQTEATPEDAARMLLAGTNLSVTKDSTGALIVQRADGPQSGSAAGDGAEVEALIVTAQKREEDIQDVPIAISAFTQEDLTRSQIAGGPDLITQVPNMTFTKTNFSSYSIQLRGIGTQAISATTDPAVAVAFNNTPFIRNRFFEQEFYDLQRVEVLRGPQGTLYGRNATAGVVNIISQKPRFNFEAKASGDVSNFNSSRIEGMVNIPLVEDHVALRLAGAWTKRDGYATNELTGNPIDGRDLWSTRVSLRIKPNDRIDANLIWEHFEEDDDRLRSGKQLCKADIVTNVGSQPVVGEGHWVNGGNGHGWSDPQGMMSQGCERNSLYAADSFETPNGYMLPYYMPLGSIGLPTARDNPYVNTFQSQDLRVIESTVDPGYRAKADLLELQVGFDLSESLTLSSETSYNTDFIYSTQDFNRFNTAPGAWAVSNGVDPYDPTDQPSHAFTQGVLDENGVFCDPQLGCSDRLVAVDLSTAQSRQFSQEFRLSSDFDGPFNFSLGANYLRYDTEDKYYVFINSLSLIAASGTTFAGYDSYVPGVTDNADCMFNGYEYGNPEDVYGVTGCIYIDPNPLASVNDQGHNYFLSRNPYKLISYAAFGESYFQLSETLKVTAGLRWTVDKKDAPRIPSWLLASRTVGYPVAEVVEQEWREPTGRLAIDWKPDLPFTDETLLYASYAHGYKAGGANPPGYIRVFYVDPVQAAGSALDSETRPKTFDAEFVDAYELGSKNTLLDGALTLNLAAFYYDYKDYQISEIIDRSAYNRNLDATIWGIEAESDWRPLENLRFGVKVGYEETRIADGETAVDLMDRTAGDPDWVIVRPFPTYASSCILPTRLFDRPGGLYTLGSGIGGGNPGPCEIAYGSRVDPVTGQPYQPGVIPNVPGFTAEDPYIGFDPSTAPNGGEGISKNIGGNELPNAPNLTATITADYTIPLPNEWLATLHTDLHWQGESDWRIFQDHDYSVLDEYFTMNLAAIFTNEERGWNLMAYVKNVTDETAITGAFLNSDDTGLTTNVFLTEPRLYGLRVTKTWSGGPLLGSFGARRDGPFPLTVELGGQIQRHDAPNVAVHPDYAHVFTGPIDVLDATQDNDLDWGDGRFAKVTWRPKGPWTVSAEVRFGKTNGASNKVGEEVVGPVCAYPDAYTCEYLKNSPTLSHLYDFAEENRQEVDVHDREDHMQVAFTIGRDVGLGGLSRSNLSGGLAYAKFNSDTEIGMRGVPDWYIVEGFYFYQINLTHTVYDAHIQARRESEGWGPIANWEAALPLLSNESWGSVDLDWSVGGGVLFGQRDVAISGSGDTNAFEVTPFEIANRDVISTLPHPVMTTDLPIVDVRRSSEVTIPVFNASLGASYRTGAFTVGAGYRWERYVNAVDGGFEESRDEDRTIDGPYFKLSVGFGG